MNRHIVMLAFAGALIVGQSGPTFAQMSQSSISDPSGKTVAQTSSAPAATPGAAPAARDQIKAQRVAARGDCRAQGKQQSLTRDALKNFVKSCMAQAH
jgi:hypothetical protein